MIAYIKVIIQVDFPGKVAFKIQRTIEVVIWIVILDRCLEGVLQMNS